MKIFMLKNIENGKCQIVKKISLVVLTTFIILATPTSKVASQGIGSRPTSMAQNANLVPYRRVLDPKTEYTLQWTVDRRLGSILFSITISRTSGYVALGLTRRGQIDGSDVAIFGMSQNGRPYIHDMHGLTNYSLAQDAKQDWRIIAAQVTGERTLMKISRDLDTCDNEDFPLSQDLTQVIWGYGDDDRAAKWSPVPFISKGAMPIYLLDSEIEPLNAKKYRQPGFNTWRISRTFRIPPRHTSYWCSIHRGPVLRGKHHIFGYQQYFGDELSRRHVHHQMVYRCSPPPGTDPESIFEPLANRPGEECYNSPNPTLPTQFCREVIYLWAVGGMNVHLPEHVGYGIGETPFEYYMLETHYDNPEIRDDLMVQTGVDFDYSSQLRKNEGGVILGGFGSVADQRSQGGVFAIPPQSNSFTISGQCSSKCTQEMLGDSAVVIFGSTLHTHVAGRQVLVRHFRNNEELPWIISDNNYDFNFQQLRILPSPVTILPGDHLVTECVFDNTWKNSSTVSGFSTRDEMCNAFLYATRRLPYMYCNSEYPSDTVLTTFGVLNTTWELESYERVVTVAAAPELQGLRFSQAVDRVSAYWSPARRESYQLEARFGTHRANCPSFSVLSGQDAPSTGLSRLSVAFPRSAITYQPPSRCEISTSYNTYSSHFSSTLRYPQNFDPKVPKSWINYRHAQGGIPVPDDLRV